MESYVDLIVLSIAVGASVLLLLLLISFIILSRRANNLEDEIERLKEHINANNTSYKDLKDSLNQLTTKLSTTQKTVSYVAKNMDGMIDVQEKLTLRVNNLATSQQTKNTAPHIDNTVESSENVVEDNNMLSLAQQMIKEGVPLVQIEEKTHLSRSELDMLYSVTKRDVSDNDTVDVDVAVDNSSKVANFKARNAYGMSHQKSLSTRQR